MRKGQPRGKGGSRLTGGLEPRRKGVWSCAPAPCGSLWLRTAVSQCSKCSALLCAVLFVQAVLQHTRCEVTELTGLGCKQTGQSSPTQVACRCAAAQTAFCLVREPFTFHLVVYSRLTIYLIWTLRHLSIQRLMYRRETPLACSSRHIFSFLTRLPPKPAISWSHPSPQRHSKQHPAPQTGCNLHISRHLLIGRAAAS